MSTLDIPTVILAVVALLCLGIVVRAWPPVMRQHRRDVALRNLGKQFNQIAYLMGAVGLSMAHAADLMDEFVQAWSAEVVETFVAATALDARLADVLAADEESPS